MDIDYVVVGAGAAGCVLADRLARAASVSVLLIEAGGRNRNPLLRIPKGFYLTMRRPEHAYHYLTRPVPGGQAEVWLRGKGLGGSTAINGMMYTRGSAADYDGLAARAPGWDWSGVLPAFRALEDHELGPSPVRGVGGPVRIGVPHSDDPVVLTALAAAGELGLNRVEDTNAGDEERIGFVPSMIDAGRRVSADSAFLSAGRRRAGTLHVLTGTRAGSLLFDGGRVVGVRVRRGGVLREIRARREVLLAAGSVESPLLLERSGIGDPAVLARAGVEVRVASPNVGERVLEHRGLTVHARLRPGLGLNQRLAGSARQALAGAGYLVTRRGPIATGPYDLVGALRSAPDEPRPDVQILLTAMSTDPDADRLRLAGHAGMMIQGYPLRPTTTGAVHLGGPDPDDPPVIDARYLRTEADRRVTGRILDRLRALLGAAPLAELVVGEDAPGPDVVGPQAAVGYAAATGAGIYHAVGSCGAGPEPDDVVDAGLRVRGVAGLRVVDASVFPAMPSGNTAAPTMALAWRAADLVLAER
jgi:choline dehydrogenase-like flavoprotein